ncbi:MULTISPECIES: hypothetical protein [Streptomycetaceae]|uniref:hypothetical protein n=1 Tax=Streptomycetaceae TaxID=2062 RepID=UPI00093EDFE0|nr:hypothetical protein [Streptomyces sp. CB02056]OKH97521.1 hypothetical protein AMK13_38050 [Streptomyces sp. CB02056]
MTTSTPDTATDPCPDCQAAPGDVHQDDCDIALCAQTGRQRLMCGHDEDDERCRSTWTGQWPGTAECREWDWYVRDVPGLGLVPCPADAPDAVEDLNRLNTNARWNPDTQRFQRT